MTKLVDLCEEGLYEGSITNDETGWFIWRFDNKWRNWLIDVKKNCSITNDETGWFMWRRFDNKWRNWLIYMKVR